MDKNVFLDCLGGCLIGLCILGLIGSFAFSYFLFCKNDVQDVNLQIVMAVDSTGVLSSETAQQVEGLKTELVRHEQLLEDRYKHVLEQKENLNDMLTIGSMFLTIVLALFGFFGYKSMITLEEKVKKDAKTTASNKAEETTKTCFDTYKQATTQELKTQLDSKVSETVKLEVAKTKETTKAQLKAFVKRQVVDVKQKVEDVEVKVYGTSNLVGELDEKVSKLTDKVEELKKNNARPKTGRRTLANGGKES